MFFRPLHEQIICCIKKNGKKPPSPKDRSIGDIWEANRIRMSEHPFEKPEPLIKIMIENCSNKGDTILDPFLGSGTTMKVAQDLARSCIGIEISPRYCQLAKDRCFGRQFLDRKVEYEFLEGALQL